MSLSESLSTAQSVVLDGLHSYSRAAAFLSGSNIASPPDDLFDDDDPEAQASPQDTLNDTQDTYDPHGADDLGAFPFESTSSESISPSELRPALGVSPPPDTPRFSSSGMIPSSRARSRSRMYPRHSHTSTTSSSLPTSPTQTPTTPSGPTETSPLLRRPSISFKEQSRPERPAPATLLRRISSTTLFPTREAYQNNQPDPQRQRRFSKSSHRDVVKIEPTGGSSFGQSLFNSIAILLGIGILSTSYAFSQAGWVMGTVITISYGFITCYTAKILAHIILSDPHLRTYADCSSKAFGPRSTFFTSLLFCFELFTVSVILIVLFADSLHAVAPAYSANTYKLFGLLILIPSAFFPLSVISYTSLLSIIATLFIPLVVFIDGFSKTDAPGSLWNPAQTDLWPRSAEGLGLSFGLFMAGFAGHAVVPSIARDMRHPEQFDTMINWAFGITTLVYSAVGAAGYLMFGRAVSDEISQDLLDTPGYNPTWARIGLYMLILSPITKFALSTRPLNVTLEVILGLEPSMPGHLQSQQHPSMRERRSNASLADSASASGGPHSDTRPWSSFSFARLWKTYSASALRGIERIVLIVIITLTAILLPSFGIIMSILGAFSAFTLCVIGPLGASIAIGGWNLLDGGLLGLAIVMAVWGTTACVTSQVGGV